MQTNLHKNGRPQKTGQLYIQRVLRTCFERGVSARVTARETKINVKTVCKYFDVWTQEITELEESDFFERQKNERARTIISLENQIIEAYKLLDEIKLEIKKLNEKEKVVPRQYFSFKLDVMRYISFLTEKKGSFAMQPTMDEALEKKIDERITKHDNSRKDS